MSYKRIDKTESRWLLVDNLYDAVKDVLREDLILGGIEAVKGVWVVGSYDHYFHARAVFEDQGDALEAAGPHEVMGFVEWGQDISEHFGIESERLETCEGYGPAPFNAEVPLTDVMDGHELGPIVDITTNLDGGFTRLARLPLAATDWSEKAAFEADPTLRDEPLSFDGDENYGIYIDAEGKPQATK